MGLRSAAAICQRVTNAVAFILFKLGLCVLNYLDDFAGAETRENASFAYNCLELVLKKCGFKESFEKASPPSEVMTFLGVLFDTNKMTLEVTPERLIEIKSLVQSWMIKEKASLKELQSLIGKLNFVAACVRSGRLFISRLINWLKDIYKLEAHLLVTIPEDVHKDILWWNRFLFEYNGISIMLYDNWSKPDEIFSTDACLQGIGGFCDGKYFHADLPKFILEENYSICVLELLGIVVALKLWYKFFTGKRIIVRCDNFAVCQLLNSGKSRISIMQDGLREISFFTAIAQCELRAVHLPSSDNRIADCLSRWNSNEFYKQEFNRLTSDIELHCEYISEDIFQFINDW
jgi:hypothetical protein